MNQMTYLDCHGKTIKFMFGKNYHWLNKKECRFNKLMIPVAGPFFAEFWLYEDGDLWHAITECGTVDFGYAYIEDSDNANFPTDPQVDTIINLLKNGYQAEGWDCEVHASAPLQEWLQRTAYGKRLITEHYNGVPLA